MKRSWVPLVLFLLALIGVLLVALIGFGSTEAYAPATGHGPADMNG